MSWIIDKIHLHNESSKPYGDMMIKTMCSRLIKKSETFRYTNELNKVTCKSCLKQIKQTK